MSEAYEEDRKSIELKKPALNKLFLSKRVFEELKKKSFADDFVESNGLDILAAWIDILPGGIFPNYNLVEGVLNCLDKLKIDSESIKASGIIPIL